MARLVSDIAYSDENKAKAAQAVGLETSDSGFSWGAYGGGAATAGAIAYAILAAKKGGFKEANLAIKDAIRGTRVGQYLRDKWYKFSPNSAAKAELKEAGIKDYSEALKKLKELTQGLNSGEAGLTQESLQSAAATAAGYKDFRKGVADKYRSLRNEVSTGRDRLNELRMSATESNIRNAATRDKVAKQLRSYRKDLSRTNHELDRALDSLEKTEGALAIERGAYDDAVSAWGEKIARVRGVLDPINFGEPIMKREELEAIKGIVDILRQP